MKSRLFALTGTLLLAAGLTAPATAGSRPIGLYKFDGASGYDPDGGVIADRSGTVYGTTDIGGSGPCDGGAGCGTVYALSPPKDGGKAWTLAVLYNFQGGQDGYYPTSQLTLGPHGSLFGTTAAGNNGNVFQLLPPAGGTGPWTFQILYTFTGKKDGSLGNAVSPLILHGGKLYGVAYGGSKVCGQAGCGSVFELSPPAGGSGSWTEKTLYEFPGGAGSGEPTSIVGPDTGKSFYVSTVLGDGAVVQISSPDGHGKWTATVLTTFNGGDDGSGPASLVLMPGDALYGIASASKAGFAFELTEANGAWTRTKIADIAHRFYGPTSLAAGPDGSLVGAIFGDVDFFPGAVFQLTPPQNGDDWTYAELCNFDHGPDRNPVNVVTGKGGHLFGVLNGGDSGNGALFEVR